MLERIPAENLSCPGQYPVFLWLFKDIMEEVREQLEFQDHLVAAVTDWKNQIIAELKSDKNIIFIGVHCRNDRFNHFGQARKNRLLQLTFKNIA